MQSQSTSQYLWSADSVHYDIIWFQLLGEHTAIAIRWHHTKQSNVISVYSQPPIYCWVDISNEDKVIYQRPQTENAATECWTPVFKEGVQHLTNYINCSSLPYCPILNGLQTFVIHCGAQLIPRHFPKESKHTEPQET